MDRKRLRERTSLQNWQAKKKKKRREKKRKFGIEAFNSRKNYHALLQWISAVSKFLPKKWGGSEFMPILTPGSYAPVSSISAATCTIAFKAQHVMLK